MATLFERPSARRKLVYFAAAFCLFVVNTFLWRGVATRLTGGKAFPWTVTATAQRLELRELSRGGADLPGSAVRLLLTGSRGLVITALWVEANEKQKRHEWNKLELLVKSLTKLQPHLMEPWLFQSWNLTYNVSVESDRVKDKFFYIARGIELLAEGERINRENPDIRYQIAFYYQNKFGVSDEANTLRSLLQMSCIDPADRDPNKLRPDGRTVDPDKFEEFCVSNPRLVRRLRDKLDCKSPADIVDFVADNRRIPSRYYDPEEQPSATATSRLKPNAEQFPILPDKIPEFDRAVATGASTLSDDFDAFQVARSWFSYAQDPLPPAKPMVALENRAEVMRLTGKRLPRKPAEIIFRHGPARAQSYSAEWLEKEGWFDDEGWPVDEGRTGSGRWFSMSRGDVALGKGQPWAVAAWSTAFNLWRKHGEESGMYLEEHERNRLEEKAKLYRDRQKLTADTPGNEPLGSIEDPDLRDSARAHRQLAYQKQNLGMTNFQHHYFRANAEQDPATVQGRKLFFQAAQLRRVAEPDQAMKKYEEAFSAWQGVLVKYKDFRDDGGVQDEIYEHQLDYLNLIQDNRGQQIRPALIVQGILTEAATPGPAAALAVGLLYDRVRDTRSLPLPIVGPMDKLAPDGKPWIDPEIGAEVRRRLGLEAPVPVPRTDISITPTPGS